MENYKDLGRKYLSRNRKRSLITVIGCFIVTAGIFCFLNTMVCWVVNCRIEARETDDYEIVVLTEDKDTIERIANEKFVTSAFLGKEYSWVNGEAESVYGNVLHINVREKLLINYYSKYISKTYGVETELNDLLSWTYCQDNEGVGYLMLLGGLFIALIFAIIGVGVLRNNISISAMERVKDYGNLRCIGATKKQIKAIVYRESVLLESVGIAAGVLVGFLFSIPICRSPKLQYPIGLHIIPIIIVAIAFYGDMYFAVDDGLKKVLAVSPSEAVRGNYRIKTKKVKGRKSGIWGLIFGVEGDYAYKNIKRNNGRFIKTVSAMSFGMIMVIFVGGIFGAIYKYYKKINTATGYYQHYIACDPDNLYTHEEQKADLYSPQAFKTISTAKGITDSKFLYQEILYFTEDGWLTKHFNNVYLENTLDGYTYSLSINKSNPDDEEVKKQERKAYRDSGKGLVDYENIETYNEMRHDYTVDMTELEKLSVTGMYLYGYDDEDMSRFEDCLVEGTMDLSENGILLINQAEVFPYTSGDEYSVLLDMKHAQFTDLKLGDEITVVNPDDLYELVQEERKNAEAYDKQMKEKEEEWDMLHKGEKDQNGNPEVNPYSKYQKILSNRTKEAWIINSAREKLVEEGKYKTYVIEGIVDGNPNWAITGPTIVVPLNKFYDMTGRTESDYLGMKFHVRNIFSKDFQRTEFVNALHEKENVYYEGIEDTGPTYNSYTSYYIYSIGMAAQGVKIILTIVGIIVILIFISILNTLNVTISGLQTRRNEFAQLRALGMTKKSLLKAVILEGGIVWIVSTIIGIILGIVAEYYMYISVGKLILNSGMYIFWPGIIITAILSLIVLCGSNYVFFNQMKLDVASELIRSGE